MKAFVGIGYVLRIEAEFAVIVWAIVRLVSL
jgi:hypothetical protein